MTFRDKTFCASPDCTNKCGRKMTEIESAQLAQAAEGTLVSYSYFCGERKVKDE